MGRRRREVYVSIDLDEFENDDLIDELRTRGVFIPKKSEAVDGIQKAARYLMEDLLGGRSSYASSQNDLLEALGPLYHVVDALAALEADRVSDAIVHLDRFIDPVPASVEFATHKVAGILGA